MGPENKNDKENRDEILPAKRGSERINWGRSVKAGLLYGGVSLLNVSGINLLIDQVTVIPRHYDEGYLIAMAAVGVINSSLITLLYAATSGNGIELSFWPFWPNKNILNKNGTRNKN